MTSFPESAPSRASTILRDVLVVYPNEVWNHPNAVDRLLHEDRGFEMTLESYIPLLEDDFMGNNVRALAQMYEQGLHDHINNLAPIFREIPELFRIYGENAEKINKDLASGQSRTYRLLTTPDEEFVRKAISSNQRRLALLNTKLLEHYGSIPDDDVLLVSAPEDIVAFYITRARHVNGLLLSFMPTPTEYALANAGKGGVWFDRFNLIMHGSGLVEAHYGPYHKSHEYTGYCFYPDESFPVPTDNFWPLDEVATLMALANPTYPFGSEELAEALFNQPQIQRLVF